MVWQKPSVVPRKPSLVPRKPFVVLPAALLQVALRPAFDVPDMVMNGRA